MVSSLFLSIWPINSLHFLDSMNILFEVRFGVLFHYLSLVVILHVRNILLVIFHPIIQLRSALRYFSNILLSELCDLQ